MKKKQMSATRRRQIEKSNCYECAFRYPMGCNPHSCLYGIRDDFGRDQDGQLCSCPGCEYFIHEKMFKRNIDQMFGITKELQDWVSSIKEERTSVTIELPVVYVSAVTNLLIDYGEPPNSIRKIFKMEESENG